MSSTIETVKQPKSTSSITQVNKKAMNLAASWYIAMESKDLGKKPKAIELFGQQLVAWRDQTGHPVIMARYCSHMGASLAIGEVVDGCIRCPYHHWRYDGSGQCVSLPEVEHIPPTARQATYVTVERYGYIWVWYGSETPLFSLPEFPVAENQRHNYRSLRYVHETKTTVWRLVESGGADYYHGVGLHKVKISGSPQLTLLNDQHPEQQTELPLEKEAWLKLRIDYPVDKYLISGPFAQALGISDAQTFSFLVNMWPSGSKITASMGKKEIFKLLLCATPIAENKTIEFSVMMLKKTGKFWLDIPNYLLHNWQNKIYFEQDLQIWDTENPHGGGAYVKHDRGILKFRELYQRWVDKVS